MSSQKQTEFSQETAKKDFVVFRQSRNLLVLISDIDTEVAI